jgi:fatty-acyl-CoA synthase
LYIRYDFKKRPALRRRAKSLKQGRPLCGVDLALADDDGARIEHDGATPGRLLIRGVTVVRGYFNEPADALDAQGWFDTGDIATIDALGYVQITDRAKDLIKSGGEWISSIEIENIAMDHPKSARAAVIAVPHDRWGERPLLLVELLPGETATAEEFLSHLRGRIARWWMPDEVRFVAGIPLGPTGKIDKKRIRSELLVTRVADRSV